MFGRRSLLLFVIKVFVLILVFSSFWPFVAPGYATLLSAAANGLAPSSINFVAVESEINIYSGAQLTPFSLQSLIFQAGQPILMALILATPGLGVKKWLKYIIVGVVLTFGIHIASILILSINIRSIRPLVVLFASVGIDLFPVLIWVGLTARYWWPGRTKVTPQPGAD